MKIAILQCDEVLVKLQPEFGQYENMIKRMFAQIPGASEWSFDCFDCRQREYPENLESYDFYITTGSKSSVYDDEPWIKQLIAFVQQLEKACKKLVGICFGHQLIAAAYREMVASSEKGWGIGVATNRVVATPDWMNATVDELHILVSHQDQVLALPPGALVIAKSDFCPYFVVQWSDHFLSIQGHPEWTHGYSRALINERRTIIPPERVESGLDSLSLHTDNQLFARWVVDFVAGQSEPEL